MLWVKSSVEPDKSTPFRILDRFSRRCPTSQLVLGSKMGALSSRMAGVFAVGTAQTKSPTKRKNPTKHPAEWARKGLVCFFFWLVCACSFLLLPNLTLGLPCFVMRTRVRVHVCASAISCTVISCAWCDFDLLTVHAGTIVGLIFDEDRY